MATPADLVRGNAAQLAAYRADLEHLITEQSTGGTPGLSPRNAEPPLPGNAPAFSALMVIWEHVPRLEAALRLAVTGHPGQRRGGSAGNFLQALAAIPQLAAGLDEDAEAATARILERLANLARAVPDIDEAQQWRHLRGRACPYCGCLTTLKVLLDARGRPTGHVECFAGARVSGERCLDGNGRRPVAAVGTDGHGRPMLEWADGLVETAPDLDG